MIKTVRNCGAIIQFQRESITVFQELNSTQAIRDKGCSKNAEHCLFRAVVLVIREKFNLFMKPYFPIVPDFGHFLCKTHSDIDCVVSAKCKC
jgi:hypothetical protein